MRSLLFSIVFVGICGNSFALAQSTNDEQALIPEALESQLESSSPSPQNPYKGDLRTRRYLSGDWFGRRSKLAENGVTMDMFATQFYQGVTSGGLLPQFEYGGKLDVLPNFDGQKLGLWQGLSANAHVETRFGTTTNANAGTLLPSNAAMAFPFDPDTQGVWLTALKFNQALSEHFVVFAGKLNGLDGYVMKYSPGVATNLPGLGDFKTRPSCSIQLQRVAFRIRPLAQGLQSFLEKAQRLALASWTLRSDPTAEWTTYSTAVRRLPMILFCAPTQSACL